MKLDSITKLNRFRNFRFEEAKEKSYDNCTSAFVKVLNSWNGSKELLSVHYIWNAINGKSFWIKIPNWICETFTICLALWCNSNEEMEKKKIKFTIEHICICLEWQIENDRKYVTSFDKKILLSSSQCHLSPKLTEQINNFSSWLAKNEVKP